MTRPTPNVPKCPLCPRVRREDRPLCNRDMRHAGTEVVGRYLTRLRIARDDPNDRDAQRRLAAVIEELMTNARTYNRIRAQGLHPFWDLPNQRWLNPRDRARAILGAWTARHAFGVDPTNDRAVIDRIAAELFPPTDQ